MAEFPVATQDQPQTPQLTPDEMVVKLGQTLRRRFDEYVRDRRMAELKWLQNARQFLGEHDPEVKAALDATRSRAYPRLTRVKVMSMVARLMNLLFPTSEKNWTLAPSMVPNLAPEDLQLVLEQLAADAGNELEDSAVEEAIRKFAQDRADNLCNEVQDQLDELGGDKTLDYVALCKMVILSAVQYGCGVMKGPFVREQPVRRWTKDPATNTYTATMDQAKRPMFEFVSVWDYYPDLSAKTFAQMDGQFERHIMSRHQLRKLADRSDFRGDAILKYLAEHQQGNYKRQPHEVELKAMGVQNFVGDQNGRKYEIIQWHGYVAGTELAAGGVDVPENMRTEELMADVWMIDETVIKVDLDPWVEADTNYHVTMYHQFIFEHDETSLLGNGLPSIMRDSQMGATAATMLLMDNASVACTPSAEVNVDRLYPGQDQTTITPFKVWYTEGVGPEAANQAVRPISYDAHIPELLQIIEMFDSRADQETFVGPQTGGDQQKGPSEPFRTAAGASMLRGDAALPFKDVVRNFDSFTRSVISALVAFNHLFSNRTDIIGDFQIVARGASSLVAKEVRGLQVDNMMATLHEEDMPYVDRFELLKERFATRDLPRHVIVSDEEAVRIKQSRAEEAEKTAAQQEEMVRAEVRKVLAETVKNLTQAEKNSANAAGEQVNTMLETLERGLSIETGGGEKPAGGAAPAKKRPAGSKAA
jgi:hypothetical protein